jgi:hypothetical protein
MVVPEHTKVPDADRRHEGTNHLVELARGCSENPSECRVPHVQERFYGSFDPRVYSSLFISLVLCQSFRDSCVILNAGLLDAKRDVS